MIRKKACLFSPVLFNIVLDMAANAITEEKIKHVQIGNEDIKLSLFANNIREYIENPKRATHFFPRINKGVQEG